MTTIMSIGAWIRRRRKSLDLTQKELAEQIGCSVAAVQKIEGEERRPSRQIAELLAGALEIPPAQREIFIKVARGLGMVERLEYAPGPMAEIDAIGGAKPKSNLPVPMTPLVGRENEIAELIRLLREPDCRLLTVVGEGGIGKTRLCLEVARTFVSGKDSDLEYTDGVYYIALAPVTTSPHILSAMAEAIGFSLSGHTDDKSQLIAFLQGKQMLLVLDNLEQLLHGPQAGAAQLISDILRRAPGVKTLATSRERLNLQEEWIFEVVGLPYPLLSPNIEGTEPQVQADALFRFSEFSAVKLFLQTVRRRDAQFHLSSENYGAVLRICHLVNGMPLGIELAAGWTSTLTCHEIAQEIAGNLDFLATTVQNVPKRHRSIRAAFDHSWKLLSEIEQAVLSKLAVFQGGFRREAAEQIAGATLPILSLLIDKSLVHRSLPGRYDIHELVRQYAREHLKKQPEPFEQTLDRHSSYYLSFLEDRFPSLRNHEQQEVLAELTSEIDNLRQAWDWAVSRQQVDELNRVSVPFMVYHELRNQFHEGANMFQHAMEVVQRLPDSTAREIVLADLMAQRAWFGFRLGKMPEALEQLSASIALLRKHDARILLAEVLWYYAFACWFHGAFDEAFASTQEGLERNSELNRRWQVAIIRLIRGGVFHDMGAYQEADDQLSEAVRLCRETGDPRIISVSLSMFSRNKQMMNQFSGIKEILQEGLRLATETGDWYGVGMALEQLGVAAQAAGAYQEARARFSNCIQLFREIGDLWSLSRSYNSLGRFFLEANEMDEASDRFIAALSTALSGRAMAYAMDALANLALVEQRRGNHLAAFRYAACILAHKSSPANVKERTERLFIALKSQMLPEDMEKAASSPISVESLPAAFLVGSSAWR